MQQDNPDDCRDPSSSDNLCRPSQRPSLHSLTPPHQKKKRGHVQRGDEKGSSRCLLPRQCCQQSCRDSIKPFSDADGLPLALAPTKAISNELTPLLSLIQRVWRLSEAQLSIHGSYTSPSGLWFQETSLPLLSSSLLHSLKEYFSEGPWSRELKEKRPGAQREGQGVSLASTACLLWLTCAFFTLSIFLSGGRGGHFPPRLRERKPGALPGKPPCVASAHAWAFWRGCAHSRAFSSLSHAFRAASMTCANW